MLNIREYEAMAKLKLSEGERETLAERLNALTEGFAALDEINTEGAEPLYTVLCLNNILREDISVKLVTRDELLSSAPEQYDGYFKVPGTLE